MIKGMVMKDKKAERVIESLQSVWCFNNGFPTVGFYADNGEECQNYKMEEFVIKLGMRIESSL